MRSLRIDPKQFEIPNSPNVQKSVRLGISSFAARVAKNRLRLSLIIYAPSIRSSVRPFTEGRIIRYRLTVIPLPTSYLTLPPRWMHMDLERNI